MGPEGSIAKLLWSETEQHVTELASDVLGPDALSGPWARDHWGFYPIVQWLANRGYAVLQVNYRGSTGYGKKFLNAGNREWAGKMHDDLIDGSPADLAALVPGAQVLAIPDRDHMLAVGDRVFKAGVLKFLAERP